MKALIIEDEKAAVRNLKALLIEIAPNIVFLDAIDSITDSIEWFNKHDMPDLVFMDIHLADGSAFEIFEHIDITCPIIFTTAYDEYALRAFKVNSIDYLLKPIDKNDAQKALDKFKRLSDTASSAEADYASLIRDLKCRSKYKKHFLIPAKGDKLLPISIDSILYFYIHESCVKAVLTDGKEYIFTQTLDEITAAIDPMLFFRANRQYLISRHSVTDIDLWFNGRLSINLKIPARDKVLVSKARVSEFKEWLGH